MSKIKPNKLTEAKKTLSQFGDVAKELPSEIELKDVGYYHFVFVVPITNKAGTAMTYKWHVAKVDKKSYNPKSKQDKTAISSLYKISAILHDPTIGEAAKLAEEQFNKKMQAAKAARMTPAEQFSASMNLLPEVEALRAEIAALKAEKGKDKK